MFIKTNLDKHIASLVGQSKLQVEPCVQWQISLYFQWEELLSSKRMRILPAISSGVNNSAYHICTDHAMDGVKYLGTSPAKF